MVVESLDYYKEGRETLAIATVYVELQLTLPPDGPHPPIAGRNLLI